MAIPEIDPRAVLAAGNNADLCELVYCAHGRCFVRNSYAFEGIDIPPPYYPNYTTLSSDFADEQRGDIRALQERAAEVVSVKDGFSSLDLTTERFRMLIEAEWVWAETGSIAPRPDLQWSRVQTSEDLSRWEHAWKACGSPTESQLFPEELLHSDKIAFYGLIGAHGIVEGCIVNRSPNCVGISNVFTETDIDLAHAAAYQSACGFGSGMPIVGYDRGPALDSMLRMGFESVGSLRVWLSFG